MNKLPDRPSELLKLAMTDLELVEKDKRYVIDMNTWHSPYNDKCAVCMAGAVMAKELELPVHIDSHPVHFQYDLMRKFNAINYFRTGNFEYAFRSLCVPLVGSLPDFYARPCENGIDYLSRSDREEWKLHMCTIIGILESEGL